MESIEIVQMYYDKTYLADKDWRACLVCNENQKLQHIESLIRKTYKSINQAKEEWIRVFIQVTAQNLDPQQQQEGVSEYRMTKEQQYFQGQERLLRALKKDKELQQAEVKKQLLALQMVTAVCKQRQQRSTVIVSTGTSGVHTILPVQQWDISVQDVAKQPLQESLHETEPLLLSGQEMGASSEFQDTTEIQLVEEVIEQEEEQKEGEQQHVQKSPVACLPETAGLQILIQAIEQQASENKESSDTVSLCSSLTRSMYDSSSPSPWSLSEFETRRSSSLLEAEEDEKTEEIHAKRQRLSASLPPLSPSIARVRKI